MYLLISLLMLGLASDRVDASDTATGPHIQVSLLSEYEEFSSGTNWLGVLLQPEAEWHTYWLNPGDSGEAPSITWTLPNGVSAGEISWPVPDAIPIAHLVNYGYGERTLLMVPIEVSDNAAAVGKIEVKAALTWLVCKEDCIPGSAELSQVYTVSQSRSASAYHDLFQQTRDSWPTESLAKARHEITDTHLMLELPAEIQHRQWYVFPHSDSLIQHAALQQINQTDGTTIIAVPKSDYLTGVPEQLDLLLSDGTTGISLSSDLASNTVLAEESSTAVALWFTAMLAFAGGLILNLMPCVLPILSMKALSLSSSSDVTHNRFAYALGILFCFNAFALIVIAMKSGGDTVGWGFHLQQPWMIVTLAFLFTYIALSLLDVLPQSGRWAGMGDALTRGDGFSAQFFTGVLAVVVASPCTAPFMAAAIGVAMVSEAFVTIVIFNALALGFALPLTLIYLLPALQRLLPKPGMWMEKFKHFMAFPMLATVAWLLWVYSAQTSDAAQLLLMFCLLGFSMALWLLVAARKVWPVWIVLAAVTILLPLWQGATAVPVTSAVVSGSGVGFKRAFSPDVLDGLLADDQVVLVNMTADWCITCKVNEKVALSSERLEDYMKQENVHYLVGDWTNKNDVILNYLQSFDRSGVPLYVVYSGSSSFEVLPQLLTTDIVIDAITSALEN